MAVEEDGELDAVITKKDLEREKARLEELKGIANQRKKLAGAGSTAGAKKAAREANEAAKKQAKQVKKMEAKIREIDKKQKATDNKVKSILGKGSKFLSSPESAVGELAGELGSLGRAGPIALAIIAASTVIFKMIEKEFGDGGIFDLRVKVKDAVKSIVAIKNLADIDAGIIFMSADPGIYAIPEFNNTTNKRDGHVIYNQLTLGHQ